MVVGHSQNVHSQVFVDKMTPSAAGVATHDRDTWKLFICYLSAARIRKPRTSAGRYHWIWRHEKDKSPISVSGTMRMRKSDK